MEIKEAIEVCKQIIPKKDSGTFLSRTKFNKQSEAISVLASFAQQMLDTPDELEKKYDYYSASGAPPEMDSFEASAYSKGVVKGNNELHDIASPIIKRLKISNFENILAAKDLHRQVEELSGTLEDILENYAGQVIEVKDLKRMECIRCRKPVRILLDFLK
jgi:hypothetical protein